MTALINLLCWGWLAWLVLFAEPFLTYGNSPFPVETPFVKPGEVAITLVTRCNSSAVSRVYTIAHELIDAQGNATLILASTVGVSPGCHTDRNFRNIIPLGTPPGKKRLHGIAEVQGFLRTHLVEWYSQEFEVTASE